MGGIAYGQGYGGRGVLRTELVDQATGDGVVAKIATARIARDEPPMGALCGKQTPIDRLSLFPHARGSKELGRSGAKTGRIVLPLRRCHIQKRSKSGVQSLAGERPLATTAKVALG
jgi:hypothetical protein